jgi:hypothetical protein
MQLQHPAAHVYLDWQFWAAVVAALALILSQLPPLHLLLRRAKLGMELYSRVHLTHKVGNPNVQLHIILNNLGGRAVRVRGITLKVRRDGTAVGTFPAQNYLAAPDSSQSVLFTSFSIKPKDEWAHIVNFLNCFVREDDKKYRAAELVLKSYISEQKTLPENANVMVEASPAVLKPFSDMFAGWFVWKPGEYEVQVVVSTDAKRSSISKTYRFTLFESDSAELAAAQDDFKTGDGIYWTSGKHSGVIIPITEASSRDRIG